VIIVSISEGKGHSAFLGILEYSATYLFPFLRTVYRDSSFERLYLFYWSSLFLAAAFFLLFRVLSHFSHLRSTLSIVAGAASLATYPLACLWYRWLWHQVSPGKALLLLVETIAVLLASVVYLERKWPIARVAGILVVAAHFALWAWLSERFGMLLSIARSYGLSSSPLWILMFNAILLPMLGFISTLAWAMYVRSAARIGPDTEAIVE
jgi:hypothetical protein